ncbi:MULTISPECIES: hypothetical protein [unclassified Paraburkholderia]|uniref:hypothetical protein n=1 Tax=unclassified Paraburkholderia TaxID=2615204 RepID=UPI0019804844|nr:MULTISPECIES: hypothetical protein [unclassified Paraburkholderia]MBN3852062.1 hypothetical protein [Paraburkholderia sp. Ac-20340]
MKFHPMYAIFACAAALWSTGSFAAAPQSSYSTEVHLSSGKDLICGVNQAAPAGGAVSLTAGEQAQADVLATQRLRLLSGPSSPYPSAYTAPTVACASMS